MPPFRGYRDFPVVRTGSPRYGGTYLYGYRLNRYGLTSVFPHFEKGYMALEPRAGKSGSIRVGLGSGKGVRSLLQFGGFIGAAQLTQRLRFSGKVPRKVRRIDAKQLFENAH